jgi:small subunit ribosomal protein S8
MTDYLGDMITRIKNAQKIKLQEVEMSPFSSKNELKILKILYREGYFRGYSQYYNIKKKRNIIKLLLKYNVRGESVVRNISRISTPGRRIYVSIETL